MQYIILFSPIVVAIFGIAASFYFIFKRKTRSRNTDKTVNPPFNIQTHNVNIKNEAMSGNDRKLQYIENDEPMLIPNIFKFSKKALNLSFPVILTFLSFMGILTIITTNQDNVGDNIPVVNIDDGVNTFLPLPTTTLEIINDNINLPIFLAPELEIAVEMAYDAKLKAENIEEPVLQAEKNAEECFIIAEFEYKGKPAGRSSYRYDDYGNGHIYGGQTNSATSRHGYGVVFHVSSDGVYLGKYAGEFNRGNYGGYGIYYYPERERILKKWHNDLEVKEYGIVYANDYTYYGEMVENYNYQRSDIDIIVVFEGYGVIIYSDNSKYVGEFMNHEYNGYGVMFDNDGNIFKQGLWQNGLLVEEIK